MSHDRTPTRPLGHPDVSLLLLAHAEQHLLRREVLPVVRELEGELLPAEQLPAAAAYLEVVWADATARARATDAALRHLGATERAEATERARGSERAGGATERVGVAACARGPAERVGGPAERVGVAACAGAAAERAAGAPAPTGGAGSHPLHTHARRYHAFVRALREAVAQRVAPLLAAGCAGDAYAVEAHARMR